MIVPTTLHELIEAGDPATIAIAAPDRAPMTRAALAGQSAELVGGLRGLGVRITDSAAIVVPNGPEMAALFVGVAAGARAAPLNPAYREEEFDFYLSDIEARVLLIEAGLDSPARAVATRRRIPIVDVEPVESAPAGSLRLLRDGKPIAPSAVSFGEKQDVALVLHTSGTTSRPKIVPLSHFNLMTSARNIAGTLRLTPVDRCLVIMPLFHIHGLIGALLSSLFAGASVFCPPGFNALKFFGWLDESAATWYSAVPTMHQAILARADRNRQILERRRLRFIRSSSASLPPPVMRALEETFGCPVIESYGMTEASHQMASNPLPPAARKPGTVGRAAGPEVAIMGPDGTLFGAGAVGEIVIRGASITSGYANNPAANAEAFRNGWFRTGDLGVMDEEGYLTISGRLKEIINRGGEKIAPREIDDVLLDHPAIAQAVTFALPHALLGEEVAAAIVLRDDQQASEREIREFVAQRLAEFKAPRRVVFLAEIPKGPTGKVQRIGLAARLGLTA
ncbi:MAG: AMP-binding protein [Methylobacteriaceae bacterium]|nr:AMP-binding protein [Methylobacteriaceae bacterium]MBV9702225.1 AMP-binding protein [Methylobacteriaceae bacterium]